MSLDVHFNKLVEQVQEKPLESEKHLLEYMNSQGYSYPFKQTNVTNAYISPTTDTTAPLKVLIEGVTKFQEIETVRLKATTDMNNKLLDFFYNVSEYNKLKELPTALLGGNDDKKLFERTMATEKQIKEFKQIEDLIGIQDIKNRIASQIIEPLRNPKYYPASNSRNIGMFGPPGTGKTMVAKGIAASIKNLLPNTRLKFFNISSSTVTSSDRGGTEKNLKAIFDEAAKVPTDLDLSINETYLGVIFIDEFESFAKSRELETNEYKNQVTTELLQLLDGFQSGKKSDRPMVIFATNLLSIIDSAILSRFGITLYISEPIPDDRFKLTLFELKGRIEEQTDAKDIIIDLVKQIETWIKNNKENFYKKTAFLSNRNLTTLVSELINYKYSELGSGKTTIEIETFIKKDDQNIWPIAMNKALEKIKIPYDEILDIEYSDLFKESPPSKEIKANYTNQFEGVEIIIGSGVIIGDSIPKNKSLLSYENYYIILMKLHKDNWEREILFYYIRYLAKENDKDFSSLFLNSGRKKIIDHVNKELTNGVKWSQIKWKI